MMREAEAVERGLAASVRSYSRNSDTLECDRRYLKRGNVAGPHKATMIPAANDYERDEGIVVGAVVRKEELGHIAHRVKEHGDEHALACICEKPDGDDPQREPNARLPTTCVLLVQGRSRPPT